ncbi:PaaI family thioesterase [Litoribrevibacter albus]|uniref:Thioesterase domain-containing protein n=1 Tax=Litoribrevibacter albus TaxID=1473156 RepID=A0AA37SC36_9GAMM|nr:PaaI family thioesterase [Litoribrevibacter albus]GLQ31896.1 hypothetical protein GCM10007876_23750 [Litoribrevibacter albus]
MNNSIEEVVDQGLTSRAQRFIDELAHCVDIGLSVSKVDEKGGTTLHLPYNPELVGNTETGVMHGGAITTLMDTASGTSVICSLKDFEICPTLDLRIDYLKAAEPNQPVHGFAECYRISRNVVFTRGYAYQNDPDNPIAYCVGTFMRLGTEFTPDYFRKRVLQGDYQ